MSEREKLEKDFFDHLQAAQGSLDILMKDMDVESDQDFYTLDKYQSGIDYCSRIVREQRNKFVEHKFRSTDGKSSIGAVPSHLRRKEEKTEANRQR